MKAYVVGIQQVEAIQKSTHNISFYKEGQKIISHKNHTLLMKSFADLSLLCPY